jgi:hypothetical protein
VKRREGERNLQPVLMKSLREAVRWVFLARQPKATQRAMRMALFPPAPPRRRRREGYHSSGGTAINGERDGG